MIAKWLRSFAVVAFAGEVVEVTSCGERCERFAITTLPDMSSGSRTYLHVIWELYDPNFVDNEAMSDDP